MKRSEVFPRAVGCLVYGYPAGAPQMRILSGVLFVFLGTSVLWGQMTTATIVGVASDETGAVVPQVAITVRNIETGLVRTTATNALGRYVVPNLIPGSYEVEATLAGFQTTKRSSIVLTVGTEKAVNLELRVGVTTETVEVVGELPGVDTETSTLSGLVDERRIRELPLNGRSYETLAVLQAGVSQFNFSALSATRGRGTQFSVTGSRPLQNSFLLDGMEITEFGGGTPGSVAGVNLGVEAIREFQILTNTFPAEFGRAPGGIINAVTRSGTNSLHGSVYHFLRNSVLDAKNFFDPTDKPIPPFKRNQFGFSLGGPIRRDRAFFFGNYEGLRVRTGLSRVAVVPSLAARNGRLPDGPVTIAEAVKPYLALYPIPNGEELTGGGALHYTSPSAPTREDYVMGRVDAQLSERDSLFVRYVFDDSLNRIPDVTSSFAIFSEGRRNHFVLGMDRIVSPAAMNVARVGFNRHFSSEDTEPLIDIDPSLSFVRGEILGGINIGGGGLAGTLGTGGVASTFAFFGASGITPRIFPQDRIEFSDTFHYTRGAHSLKWGGKLQRIRSNVSLSSKRGEFTFPSLRAFLEGSPDSYSGVVVSGYPRGYRQTNFGFFVQDDYHITPNLTLNMGLRWEFVTDPTEVNGKLSNFVHLYTDTEATVGVGVSPKKKNFQPRIGFAWSPTSSKKTAIRGGTGIFHEQTIPIVYANYLGGLPPFNIDLVVRSPGFPDPLARGTVRADPQGGSPREIDYHEPSKLQYNLNVQQELLPDTTLTVGYVGSQSRHLALAARMNDRTPTILPDGTPFYPPNAPFRNPALGSLLYGCRCGSSTYNGLVAELTRKPRGLVGFQVAYTWGKSIDNASSLAGTETVNSSTNVMDSDDWARDRARSAFDIRHVFVTNYNLQLPSTNMEGVAGALLNGWGLQGILTATSGAPMNILAGFSRSRSARTTTGGFDRPDLVPGQSNSPVLGDPALYFDPKAFALPPVGFFGNLGRNTVDGPGVVNFDFSMTKAFQFSERHKLEFRSDFFNFSNTPKFGTPGLRVFTTSGGIQPNAGKILQTVGTSRQIQLSLKLTF